MNESNISRDHIALEAMKIILDKGMEGTMADYEIVSVSETAIMDVFHYKETEASHGE